MAEVIPAILEKDFAEIEKKIRLVEKLVRWVQIDIADSTLVPNSTFLDAGYFAGLKTPVSLEVHMMVSDPMIYTQSFIDAGFGRIIAHVEGERVDEFVVYCQERNVEVGLAVDGPTPVEKILPYLETLQMS